MKLATKLAATEVTSGLAWIERASNSCLLAKQLEAAGEYEAACDALTEVWPDRYAQPILDGLDPQTSAEVLLRVGALIGWLGSAHQFERQESAKDLVTRSFAIFDQLKLSDKVAEAQSELALCYWREGGFDEARVALEQALDRAEDDNGALRAGILIRAGEVERRAGRLSDALKFLQRAAPLMDTCWEPALKGSFHNTLGAVLDQLAAAENRVDYRDRALIEYTAASYHFEQAGHDRYRARVENNLGFLYTSTGDFTEAHRHIDNARELFVALGDPGNVAQVNDTRARTFLAEGRLKEAERYAREAVRTLDRGDECSLLVEALTTHGTVKARLGKYLRARQLLDRAIETAEACGDLEGAGRARLTIIEELTAQNSAVQLAEAYKSAAELLKKSQDPSTTSRLVSCARIVIDALTASAESRLTIEDKWKNFSFQQEMRSYEKSLIARALRESGGSVTKAAKLLGLRHHQSLISLIDSRHRDLLSQRSAVRPRRRKLISKPRKAKPTRRSASISTTTAKVRILHVEDHQPVADLVADLLRAEKWDVEHCIDGDSALRKLTSDELFDVLVLDNSLPGLSGLDLAKRVRKITHRRRTPIVMLSADDYEGEAWRAGVDAFLRKPGQVLELPATINRLLREVHKR